MKTVLRFLLRILFRFRAYDLGALKTPGPVLLIPNHSSWIDWLFLWVCLEEDWKFVTSSLSAQTSWLHRKLMINHYTLPVDPGSPYAVKRLAEFLKGGGRLVLFADGRLSRTGNLMKLFDGIGFLIFKTKAKVVTENRLAMVAAIHHVINCSGIFDAQGARHKSGLRSLIQIVNPGLTPFHTLCQRICFL